VTKENSWIKSRITNTSLFTWHYLEVRNCRPRVVEADRTKNCASYADHGWELDKEAECRSWKNLFTSINGCKLRVLLAKVNKDWSIRTRQNKTQCQRETKELSSLFGHYFIHRSRNSPFTNKGHRVFSLNNDCIGARCTNEENSFGFTGKFGGSFADDGVARIKHSGAYK
jgi:hypothetical protein